jgi:sulfur-oxidizing protein SoxX
MKAMHRPAIILAALLLLLAGPAAAQQKKAVVDPAVVDKIIEKSWATAAPDWQSRLTQDETQKVCSQYRNARRKMLPQRSSLASRGQSSIRRRPADGRLEERREAGRERLRRPLHRLSRRASPTAATAMPATSSPRRRSATGTLGPSLLEYGKIRKFAEADIKAVYERIYNPHAAIACANMPRLGASKFLTIDQIRDLVAYVMSPDSPGEQIS